MVDAPAAVLEEDLDHAAVMYAIVLVEDAASGVFLEEVARELDGVAKCSTIEGKVGIDMVVET